MLRTEAWGRNHPLAPVVSATLPTSVPVDGSHVGTSVAAPEHELGTGLVGAVVERARRTRAPTWAAAHRRHPVAVIAHLVGVDVAEGEAPSARGRGPANVIVVVDGVLPDAGRMFTYG